MKKPKYALVSILISAFVFCVTFIINIQPEASKKNAEAVDGTTIQSTDVVAGLTSEGNSQALSISEDRSLSDQYLVSKKTQLYRSVGAYTEVTAPIGEADVPIEEADSADADVYALSISEASTDEAVADNGSPEDASQTEGSSLGTSMDEAAQALSTQVKDEAEALYANIGISIAKSYVNIRESASTDSKVLGKLYQGSAAEILDAQGEWYYVESGSIRGYVTSDYIKTGIPDDELIKKYGIKKITVAVDGLNVREKASTDADKVTVVYKNETYPVLEISGDWYKVNIEDENLSGYVKSEYAQLSVSFKKAVSKEEEQKLEQLEAEKKAKKETKIQYNGGVSYSKEDLKLLACLIHAEAGTQSYEGKLAVANVVLNRVKSSKYPNNIKDVIYQPGQFTVAHSGSLKKQLAKYDDYSSQSQLLSIKAAKDALDGANNVGSRMYFHSYKAALKKGYDDKSNAVKIDDQLFW